MAALVCQYLIGHAHGVPILQPALRDSGLHPYCECPVESTTRKKLIGPRLRKFLRNQQIFLTVGVLVCAVLWALRVPTTFMPIIVMSICIGNVLNMVMDYACRWYDRCSPPWNWVVYVPVLGIVSALGTMLAAGAVFGMSGAGTTYMTVLRMVAPFSMVVSMTVGILWYGVDRVQVHLRERTVQLESALAAETNVVRTQEQELARARQIQQELLPKSIPQLPGMQVAGAWQPASAVSGDYYDVLSLDQDRLAICIGDVVGKGITAALLMANLQAAFRAFATADASPASVCGKLNTFICGNVANGKFISFFYCIVDARDRSISYENAGHCPAQLTRRAGETISLRGEGAVLGVLPDWNYRNNRLQLESGDRLVLFTDGVTEAEDSYGNEFGQERVVQALRGAGGHSAEEVRRRLMEAVTEYCGGRFRDDATIVVLAVQ